MPRLHVVMAVPVTYDVSCLKDDMISRLGFVVDKADDDLGTVSATKLDTLLMRMTVTVRLRGKDQTIVRASAQYNLVAVSDDQQQVGAIPGQLVSE